jgi:L-rhamnose isomerase
VVTENFDKIRHKEQTFIFSGQISQAQLAAFSLNGIQAGHENADSGTIEPFDAFEIDHDLLDTLR